MKQDFTSPPEARTGVRRDSGNAALVVLGIVGALYFARELFIPLAFALTLTFLLTPVVSVLEKFHLGRVLSVLTTVLVSIVLAGAIGLTIADQLIEVVNQLPLYRQNIHVKIEALRHPVSGQLGQAAESVKEVAKEIAGPAAPPSPTAQDPKQAVARPTPASPMPVQVIEPTPGEWAEARDLATPFLGPLARAGMVIIFAVFMLLKREDLRNRLLRLAGPSQLNLMTQALDDAAARVSRYILMQVLVNAGFGALFGLGLYWIGVPYPMLWGVVAAILRLVPYVGTLVAATLPLALSLAVFDGWIRPVLVLAVVISLELITANLVEPWLYSSHVGISALALLVTAVFWTVLWGPAGLILSTPLTVCVVVLGRYTRRLSFLHILLGDEPVLSAEAMVYQRLLAMDQMEARTVVDQFSKDRTLVELYDSVFIPALGLAEQDRHKGAIDAAREEFLFLSINEMIAEFSERSPAEGAAGEGESQAIEAPHLEGRVLCIPAHDRADELAAAMLAQLLEQEGYTTRAFSSSVAVLDEWIPFIGAESNEVVCISALPPYAFAPARSLCRKIRERFPKLKLKVMVCVWGFNGDPQKARMRFERTPPDYFSTSLADAVEHIRQLTDRKSGAGPQVNSPVEVGPAGAAT